MTTARVPPPGPGPLPDWLLHLADEVRFADLLRFYRRLHGPVFTLPSEGDSPLVILADADAARDLYALPREDFTNGADRYIQAAMHARNLTLLEGAEHAALRKLFVAPMTRRANAEAQPLYRAIFEAEAETIRPGAPMALLPLARRAALRVVGTLLLGPDWRGAEQEALVTAALATFTPPRSRLSAGMRRLRSLITGRPATMDPALVEAHGHLNATILSLIAQRRERGSPEAAEAPLIDRLLLAHWPDGAALTDDDIRDQVQMLLVVGSETTTVLLPWVMHWLHRDPELLARVRADLSGPRTFDLLNAVTEETLRLTPPVFSGMPRRLGRDVTLGGWRFPAGTRLAVSHYLLGLDPDRFPEPERFRPERFLERTVEPHEFPPFGGGLRLCPGHDLAPLEVRLFVDILLDRFDWSPQAEAVTPLRHGAVHLPDTGVRMTPHPRAETAP